MPIYQLYIDFFGVNIDFFSQIKSIELKHFVKLFLKLWFAEVSTSLFAIIRILKCFFFLKFLEINEKLPTVLIS
jgi:hypothetical protein